MRWHQIWAKAYQSSDTDHVGGNESTELINYLWTINLPTGVIQILSTLRNLNPKPLETLHKYICTPYFKWKLANVFARWKKPSVWHKRRTKSSKDNKQVTRLLSVQRNSKNLHVYPPSLQTLWSTTSCKLQFDLENFNYKGQAVQRTSQTRNGHLEYNHRKELQLSLLASAFTRRLQFNRLPYFGSTHRWLQARAAWLRVEKGTCIVAEGSHVIPPTWHTYIHILEDSHPLFIRILTSISLVS